MSNFNTMTLALGSQELMIHTWLHFKTSKCFSPSSPRVQLVGEGQTEGPTAGRVLNAAGAHSAYFLDVNHDV